MAAPPRRSEALFAQHLRRLRESAHLTQAQLAAIFSSEGESKKVGAAAISAWENQRRWTPLPEPRLEPYARLFATERHDENHALIPEAELTTEQRASRDALLQELRELWDAARGVSHVVSSPAAATYRSWFFDDDGPAVIVAPDAPPEAQGPLADPTDPNYTELHGLADLDALLELYGHIRAENDPTFPVRFRRASRVVADDLSGHLVLLGGIAWNEITRHLLRQLDRLPVRQMEIPELATGEIFAVGHGADEHRFLPEWSPSDGDGTPELVEDVGLLARLTNPYNSSRTLTICNGVHSRGVLGAVRALTDARVREANESYLAERFEGREFAVLMRVHVVRGSAVSPDLFNPANVMYEWSPGGPSSQGRGDSRP